MKSGSSFQHVSTIDEDNEQVSDQRMLISLVGYIRGLSSKVTNHKVSC